MTEQGAEPPELTEDEREVIRRGVYRMNWQVKWLRRLRWPMGLMIGVILYLCVIADDPIAFPLAVMIVLVEVVVAIPFMCDWCWPEIKGMWAAEDKKLARMEWESRQQGSEAA